MEEGERLNFEEVEWTYLTQQGETTRSAPCSARECFARLARPSSRPVTTDTSFRVEIGGLSVASGGGSDI